MMPADPSRGSSPPGDGSTPGGRRGDWIASALIVLAVAAVYGGTLHVPWYMDDYPNIVDNPLLDDPGAVARRLFAPRGLTLFTFALNARLGGLDPAGYHVVNIAIHMAASVFAFLLLKRVFRGSAGLPLLGALLFAVHPLQTQAVTYTVQRMTILSGLFSLLSLYLFVRGRELLAAAVGFRDGRHLGFYFGSIACGALAAISKESAAALPLLLLLFARCFLPAERRWKPLLLALLPYLVVPLGLACRMLLLPLAAGRTLEQLGGADLIVSLRGNSPSRYLATQCSVLWIYLRMLIVPFGQALDHDYPVAQRLFAVRNIAGLLGLAAVGWSAFRLRRKVPAFAFGAGWFLAALGVESGVIPLDTLFEHRLYLPLFGLVVAAEGGIERIPRASVRTALLCAAVVALALLSRQRNALWRDPVAFYEDNLEKAPHSERVSNELGRRYMMAGRFEDAERRMLRALEINPGYENVYVTLPGLYLAQGRIDDAVAVLERGIANRPELAFLYNNLAMLHVRKNDPGKARELLERAIAVDPGFDAAYINLGRQLLAEGRFAEAEPYLRKKIGKGSDRRRRHGPATR